MLVLASASPRRRALLEEAGVEFVVLPVDVDETPPAGLAPEQVAVLLASRKAATAARLTRHRPVLGADTVVTIDGRILGKPESPDDVRASLRRLSGRTHDVFTGIGLVRGAPDELVTRCVGTRVTFRDLAEDEIAEYAGCAEPRGKAGAYAIQGRGGDFVAGLCGSRSNVIGLPVDEVLEMLSE